MRLADRLDPQLSPDRVTRQLVGELRYRVNRQQRVVCERVVNADRTSRERVGESHRFDANKAGRQHSVLPTLWSLPLVPFRTHGCGAPKRSQQNAPVGTADGAIRPT